MELHPLQQQQVQSMTKAPVITVQQHHTACLLDRHHSTAALLLPQQAPLTATAALAPLQEAWSVEVPLVEVVVVVGPLPVFVVARWKAAARAHLLVDPLQEEELARPHPSRPLASTTPKVSTRPWVPRLLHGAPPFVEGPEGGHHQLMGPVLPSREVKQQLRSPLRRQLLP